jgi:hypothetical protein
MLIIFISQKIRSTFMAIVVYTFWFKKHRLARIKEFKVSKLQGFFVGHEWGLDQT